MLKHHREARELAESLGYTFLGVTRERGAHAKLLLRRPDGSSLKQPIPQDMGTQRHWLNFRAQLRHRLRP